MSRVEHLAEGLKRRQPRPAMLRQDYTSIYTLSDPDSGLVRYVGKTVYLANRRLTFHMTTAKSSRLPSGRWIAKLARAGKRPIVTVIEKVPNGADWAAREQFWISHFRNIGPLLNLTNGGEGLPGLQKSPEARMKIGAALRRGAWFSCEVCTSPFWRKPHAIKNGDSRFCSKDCYQSSQRGISKPVSAICTERGLKAALLLKRSQTHCKRNHPLSGPNLFRTSTGARGCKECRKIHKLTYRGKT